MSNLEDKLKSLDIEFLHGVPVHLPDEAIEQIKRAFVDEGWIQIPQTEVVTRYEAGKKPQVFMVNGKEVMTGQEWLDRFEKEMKELDEEESHKAYAIVEAARRASGVSDE